MNETNNELLYDYMLIMNETKTETKTKSKNINKTTIKLKLKSFKPNQNNIKFLFHRATESQKHKA